MLNARRSILVAVVGLGFCAPAFTFEFNSETSCVLLNADNTDILSIPDDCFLVEENLPWCNCSKTIFTNPVKGQTTGVEQGIVQVTDLPGIGNYRVEVMGGTLDLSGVEVGDLLGRMAVNELIPEAVGFPPGSFLTIAFEMRATSVDATSVHFDVIVTEFSLPAQLILRYDPTDADHSGGLNYRGRLTANPASGGFVFEIRYQGQADSTHPGLEASDQDTPGFNVRYELALFTEGTDATDVFTLPPEGEEIDVTSTFRKMSEADDQVANPDEILPLGSDDLCEIVVEPEPCRIIEESVGITGTAGNNPPVAVIVPTNAMTLEPLGENDFVFIDCGEGRVILRGSNSTDGDGGTQGLTYLWEVVEGEQGGVVFPPEGATFMDVEMSFVIEDFYAIRLTVDDGQDMNDIDVAEVEIDAVQGQGPNLPPVVALTSEPDPPVVTLEDGVAQVRLDSGADSGADGCLQSLSYLWERVSGPTSLRFDEINDDNATVTFVENGEYVIQVTVDDGAPADNIATAQITITVGPAGNTFERCDANGDGQNDLADAVFLLNFLFGGGEDAVCRASMDCNSDGRADLADPIFDLNFLFGGAKAPEPPFPGCDRADGGECAASTPCSF